MTAWYNEIDPKAAAWLRELIKQGHIAPGVVDERDIRDVRPSDLEPYTQCHFFAGIGVWSYALRCAGWSDDRPVWTGSCPCQPFSAAGKGGGVDDERHLWPAWFWLIGERRPDTVFGEQVEAAIRHAWLDLVQTDMEGIGYAFAACGLPAAGFGAPHIRHRLWFVADSHGGVTSDRDLQRSGEHGLKQEDGRAGGLADAGRAHGERGPSTCGLERDGTGDGFKNSGDTKPRSGVSELADAQRDAAQPRRVAVRSGGGNEAASGRAPVEPGRRGDTGSLLGHPDHAGSQGRGLSTTTTGSGDGRGELVAGSAGATNGFWRDADWLPCIDGKARPTKPGIFPLAHGYAGRVGLLRGAGNAIVAPVAQEWIEAYMMRTPSRPGSGASSTTLSGG